MPRSFVLLSLVLNLMVIATGRAEDQTADKSAETEIRRVIAALQDNFNRGDAKGLAACWVADGEFVGPAGDRIVGREKIEAAFHEFLTAHPDSKIQFGISSWRRVTGDVALVDLLTEMTPVPEGMSSEPTSTAVLVQRNGRWEVGSMYEMLSSTPSHRLQLRNLQWMLGDWAENSGGPAGVTLRSACDWNANGTYLIRKFTLERSTATEQSGTEVIGWDPRNHRIRSWTFGSDGSFGESTWNRDGQQWIINHHATLANGGDLSVTYVVTPVDADTVKVETRDRLLDGQPQPNRPEVELKRLQAPSKPKSEAAETPKQVLP